MAPDPVVMANDADGIEMRAIAQGVSICDRHQDALWPDLLQARLKVRSGKGIVQRRRDDHVGGFPDKLWEKLPSWRVRLKLVSLRAAMLDENHLAGLGANLGGQPVDTIQHAAQIMFGLPIEEPDLHVDDEHRVHGRA